MFLLVSSILAVKNLGLTRIFYHCFWRMLREIVVLLLQNKCFSLYLIGQRKHAHKSASWNLSFAAKATTNDDSCLFFLISFYILMYSIINSNILFFISSHFNYYIHFYLRNCWLYVSLQMLQHWSKRPLINCLQSSSDDFLHDLALRNLIISFIFMQLFVLCLNFFLKQRCISLCSLQCFFRSH